MDDIPRIDDIDAFTRKTSEEQSELVSIQLAIFACKAAMLGVMSHFSSLVTL